MFIFIEDIEEKNGSSFLLKHSVFLYFDDLDSSLWEALQEEFIVKNPRHWSPEARSVMLLGSMNQGTKSAPDQLIERPPMVIGAHSRHVEFIST